MTSTYYPDSVGLPKWAQDFNARRLADTLLSQNWDKLVSGPYQESFADWDKYNDGEYAKYFIGEKMPYNLPDLKKISGGYGLLRFTPFGNAAQDDGAPLREFLLEVDLPEGEGDHTL